MKDNPPGLCDTWDPSLYRDGFRYVPELGIALVDILAPRSGQRILDLGCGTGELTKLIADRGAEVVGIDSSTSMITAARKRFPSVEFRVARAEQYHHEVKLDAVFSNIAMHWVRTPLTLLERIFASLLPGGRLVAQTGCEGNHAALVKAIADVCRELSVPFDNPWYYPRLGEYAGLLDHCGYDLELAQLLAQSTPLEGGEGGLQGWLKMYLPNLLEQAGGMKEALLVGVESRLRSAYCAEGTWNLDFRRMRLVARRPE